MYGPYQNCKIEKLALEHNPELGSCFHVLTKKEYGKTGHRKTKLEEYVILQDLQIKEVEQRPDGAYTRDANATTRMLIESGVGGQIIKHALGADDGVPIHVYTANNSKPNHEDEGATRDEG